MKAYFDCLLCLLLVNYCTNYKYSFREEDIGRTYRYEEQIRKWRGSWSKSI